MVADLEVVVLPREGELRDRRSNPGIPHGDADAAPGDKCNPGAPRAATGTGRASNGVQELYRLEALAQLRDDGTSLSLLREKEVLVVPRVPLQIPNSDDVGIGELCAGLGRVFETAHRFSGAQGAKAAEEMQAEDLALIQGCVRLPDVGALSREREGLSPTGLMQKRTKIVGVAASLCGPVLREFCSRVVEVPPSLQQTDLVRLLRIAVFLTAGDAALESDLMSRVPSSAGGSGASISQPRIHIRAVVTSPMDSVQYLVLAVA